MKLFPLTLLFALLCAVACSKHTAQVAQQPQQPQQPQPPQEPQETIEDKGYKSADAYPNYQLVWSDEFGGNSVDKSFWTFETGRGQNGWGNNELEYYTDKNASVQQGYLVITAKKENIGDAAYSSTRMITKGKKEFKFGRIDIRAKLPLGQGIWPALWMLGANIDNVGWPASGEIDIMELLGHEPNKSYGTLHWGPDYTQHKSKGDFTVLQTGNFNDEFHVFSIDWKQDEVRVLVDDQPFFTLTAADVSPDPYPFNAPYFFLFNVAVGGNWPGSPDASTKFPQKMVVDYIRVFQTQ